MKKLTLLLVLALSAWGARPVVLGTASFSASGGVISALATSGIVSGVSYISTGAYSVALTGAPPNYLPMISVGDTIEIVTAQIDPVSSYSSAGFIVQAIRDSFAVYDPGLVFVVIYGPPGTPSATVLGTAIFSASGGTISLLSTTGDVSGVTRTGAGQYAVALTGSPSSYIPLLSVGDTFQVVSAQVDPVSSVGPGGFTAQVIGASAYGYDPGMVMIIVIGN